MAASGAASGFVVTSGRFTSEAIRFSADCRVELIDGKKLMAIIKNVQIPLITRQLRFEEAMQAKHPKLALPPVQNAPSQWCKGLPGKAAAPASRFEDVKNTRRAKVCGLQATEAMTLRRSVLVLLKTAPAFLY